MKKLMTLSAIAIGVIAMWADAAPGQGYFSAIYAYDGVQRKTIASSYEDIFLNLDVAGSRIVWQSSGPNGSHAMLYDGTQVRQLTDNAIGGFGPHVSDSHILWTSLIGGVRQLFLYDGMSAKQITSGIQGAVESGLDGGRAIWMSGRNIFTYKDGVTTQVTDAPGNYSISWPRAGGDRIAWTGQQLGTDSEIFLWDDGVTTQITDNTINDLFPLVSDSLLAWDASTDPAGDFRVFDGTQSFTAYHRGQGTAAGLSGDRLAWADVPSPGQPGGQVKLLDNGLISTVAQTTNHLGNPAVSDTMIAWITASAKSSGSLTLNVHDGASIVAMPIRPHSRSPLVSDELVVWWENFYHPEPSSGLLAAFGMGVISQIRRRVGRAAA